jgi:polyisoprenoid-binding protein YceI
MATIRLRRRFALSRAALSDGNRFAYRVVAPLGRVRAPLAPVPAPPGRVPAPRAPVSSPAKWVLTACYSLCGLSLPALGLLSPPLAEAQTYHVDLARENRVRFVSDAPLEDFEGVTSRIDGFVYLGGEGLGAGTDLGASEFHFEVDLASLDTGIGLRNRHMRDRYLDTDRFPFAAFTGRIKVLELVSPGNFRVVAAGDLSIHGVDRGREVECGIGPVDSGTHELGDLRVQCSFTVALSDHEIPIPRFMFMRINEVMELDLDFYLTLSGLEER